MTSVVRLSLVAVFSLPLLVGCGDLGSRVASYVDWDPEYTKTWAPEVGTTLPDITAKDAVGESRTFASLTGEKGLLIFFVRSTNW